MFHADHLRMASFYYKIFISYWKSTNQNFLFKTNEMKRHLRKQS